MKLTPRQLEALHHIRDYLRAHRIAPTFQELADELDCTAPSVSDLVDALERRGALTRDRALPRSIRLTSEAMALFDPPLLRVEGQIAAGGLVEPGEAAAEYREDELLGIEKGRSFYLLEVRGDSMIERGIRNGDLVLMEKSQAASEGDVVAALDEDGQATLKSFHMERGRFRLDPANSSFKPIYLDRVRIQGVLRTVIRRVKK